MKHLLLLLFSIVFLRFQLPAQPFIDLVSVRYYSMPASYEYEVRETEGNNKWFTVNTDLPLKLKDDYLLFSPAYEMYVLPEPNNENLSTTSLPISYIKQWKNPSWKTAFTLIPRVSFSEFAESNIYQQGAAIVAIYKKRENLKYKFGVYYNSEYFGFFMLPLLGIDWNINERWNLFGILPSSMNLEYKMSRGMGAGLSFRSITNSFRAFEYDYFKIQDNHLRFLLDFYFTRHLVMTAEVGHSILRKYSRGFRNSSDKNETDLKIEDGVVYKIAFAWRIRLDEKKE
jgi:hypothetical protein